MNKMYNPLIPGDPYMYDIKWIVSKILQHGAELSNLDEKIRAAVIAALDQHDPIYFESADALINSGIKAGAMAYIEGYYTPGDGGANLYITTNDYNDIIGADFYITLAGPNMWALPIILAPFVTPEMFGAKGDGITDDTAALNISVKYGDFETLFSKHYLITAPVLTADNRTIKGLKNSLLIRGADDFNLIELGANNNFSANIKGSDAASIISLNKNELYISKDNCKIHNCNISGGDNYVIFIDSAENTTIIDNYISDYGYCAICAFNDSKNTIIKNNIIYNGVGVSNPNRYAISVSGNVGVTDTPENTIIDGNILEDLIPYWEGIDAHACFGLTVINNQIKNFISGISVVERSGITIQSRDIVISNNVIFNDMPMDKVADTNAIRVSTPTVNGAIISNNTINKTAINSAVNAINNACLRIDTNDAIISGNIIYTTTASIGLRVASTASRPAINYNINNNTITTTDIGILLGNAANVDISGTGSNNKIIGASVGISGNTAVGTNGNKFCRSYFKQTDFIDCTTNYNNVVRGLYFDVMPSLPASEAGLMGDIITQPYWNGSSVKTIHWICSASATSGANATWNEVTTP